MMRTGELDPFLERLASLCACDSPTGVPAAVDEAAALLGGWASELGCDVDAFAPAGGVHLRSTLRGRGRGRILLLGHHDTVWPAGTAAERPVRFDGDLAFGPGVADMKGGLLVGLGAIARLIERRDEFGRVELHSLPDEEARTGPPERGDLLEGADAALILECGRETGAVVSSRDAATWIVLSGRGSAAHAGQDAARGRSALRATIAEAQRIEGLDGAFPGLRIIGTRMISDGPANAVPIAAEATFDVRSPTAEGIEWALKQASEPGDHADVSFELKVGAGFPPMLRSEHLVELTLAELERVGAPALEAHAGGASDGCWTSSLGIPSVDGLGPIGGEDHTEREWIDLRSVSSRMTAVTGICLAAASRHD